MANDPRALSGAAPSATRSTGGANTGRRPSPLPSPRDDDREKRELLVEEGQSPLLNGGGHHHQHHASYFDEDKSRRSHTNALNVDGGGDWNSVWSAASHAGKQWKRAYDKDGLRG